MTWDFGGVEEEIETGNRCGEGFLQSLGRSGTRTDRKGDLG